MSWREKLRPASFRGVRFFVDDTSTSTGRKIQLQQRRSQPLQGRLSSDSRFRQDRPGARTDEQAGRPAQKRRGDSR